MMPLIEWKDAYRTGIDYVDYEHRQLVELVNEACDRLAHPGSEEGVADMLGEIYARISAHFALEERLMRERRYRLYDAHKADHERLLDEIRYMMDAYEAGACETCGKTLEACLTEWFQKHFETQDARLETLGP